MRPHLHLSLWFGLSLVCCDRTEKPAKAKEENTAPPKVTKTQRKDAVERKAGLRADLTVATKIDAPEVRSKAIAAVAWDAMELDPEVAHEAFQQLATDSTDKIRLIQHYAMRMAEQNLDEALAWAASNGSEKEIAAAKGQIALVMASTDPDRAANLLSESGIAGREFDVAVVQVLQRWAEKSPAEAAAWVVKFPPGESRGAGLKAVISPWAEKDAGAAVSWMAGLSDETLRSEARTAFAEASLEQTPEVRNAWLRLADPETRAGIERKQKEAGP